MRFWVFLMIVGVLLLMAWTAAAWQVPPAGQVLIVVGGIAIVGAGFVRQRRAWHRQPQHEQRALTRGSSDALESDLPRLDDARRRRAAGTSPGQSVRPDSPVRTDESGQPPLERHGRSAQRKRA